MTKAAARVVIYRCVNDILDAVLNTISEKVSGRKIGATKDAKPARKRVKRIAKKATGSK